MSLQTFEIGIGIFVAIISGSLVLAVAISRVRTGIQDDTVNSYKNALEAAQAETQSVRHELASTNATIAAQQKEIENLREQITVLTNMVTAREDIAGLRALLEAHHRDDMAAHQKMQDSIRDVIAMKGGTRSSELFDGREL